MLLLQLAVRAAHIHSLKHHAARRRPAGRPGLDRLLAGHSSMTMTLSCLGISPPSKCISAYACLCRNQIQKQQETVVTCAASVGPPRSTNYY